MQVEKLKQYGESKTHRMALHRVTLGDKTLEVHSVYTKVDEANPEAKVDIRYHLYSSFAMAQLGHSRFGIDPFTSMPSLLTGFTTEQLQEHMQKLE